VSEPAPQSALPFGEGAMDTDIGADANAGAESGEPIAETVETVDADEPSDIEN
jgi:hypothetical protein